MTNEEAIKWLENLKNDLGNPHYECLWPYAQAIDEICELLKEQPEIIRCKDCKNWIPGTITDNDDFIPPKCGKYQQMVGHSYGDYCSLSERR